LKKETNESDLTMAKIDQRK